MQELQELFAVICKNTTKKGVTLLEKELKKLQEGQKQHDAQLGQYQMCSHVYLDFILNKHIITFFWIF